MIVPASPKGNKRNIGATEYQGAKRRSPKSAARPASALRSGKTGAKSNLAGTIHEDKLRREGYSIIAGVDEAGRGPLAGPVAAAAVIFNHDQVPAGLADSKILSSAQRASLFDEIIATALAIGIGLAPAREIDEINIRQATLTAMKRAINGLAAKPDFVLIDGRDVPPGLDYPGRAIIKGDQTSVSIAAASIVAKVTRDRLMARLADTYPGYGFDRHVGYPTKIHRDALGKLGPTPFHRMSFAPLAHIKRR